MKDFNSPNYKRSRNAYMAQCTYQQFYMPLYVKKEEVLENTVGNKDFRNITYSYVDAKYITQAMAIKTV